ncbi:MAG: hypothetical protein GEU71_14170 [Actinobacteria bacterium]|jgi:hypothetical protein|nr:hypothetical protein [Actinomycetota bacterium]
MKKLLLFGGFVLGLAVVNAAIDSTRECGCQPECWCKQPGLRHFRWVLPFRHNAVSPAWKEPMA